MKHRRITSALAALALSGTCLAAGAGAGSAQAAESQRTLGTRSLAQVLAADGHRFDSNWRDFDIVDRFITRVLIDKPDSPLAIVTHGRQPVTAFLPTDAAFRRAAVDIVGGHFTTERQVFRALWRTGHLKGAENVLLDHLVAGHAQSFQRLADEAPTTLTTMQGGHLDIRYRDGRLLVIDHDSASPNARIIFSERNINEGNRQLAHGITAVLSPVVE